MAGASKKRTSTRRSRAVKPTVAPKQRAAAVREATAKLEKVEKAKRQQAVVVEPKRPWYQPTPKDERPLYPRLPGVFRISGQAVRLIVNNWKLILGMAIIYGVLNIILVRGISGWVNVSELRSNFDQLFNGGWGHLASGLSVFALLVGSSNSGNGEAAGAYQSFLVLITSLALIWTYRQLLVSKPPKLRVRDGFYEGIYPAVPVLLIVLLAGIQLLPLIIGGFIYTTVLTQGIVITAPEIVVSTILLLLAVYWSLYMLISTILALYIVTLPGMTPMRALRSARKLVKFRRNRVLLKLLFLPLALFVIFGIVIIPTILVVAPLAQLVFLVMSIGVLPVVHAYIYMLYRELLNE